MIELILPDRCTSCGDCVNVCPANVFEMGPAGPVIARQLDCQTCFLCELYCKVDALYVGPAYEPDRALDPDAVRASGHLGQYRRDSGWDEFADDPDHRDAHWRMGEIFARARSLAADKP